MKHVKGFENFINEEKNQKLIYYYPSLKIPNKHEFVIKDISTDLTYPPQYLEIGGKMYNAFVAKHKGTLFIEVNRKEDIK